MSPAFSAVMGEYFSWRVIVQRGAVLTVATFLLIASGGTSLGILPLVIIVLLAGLSSLITSSSWFKEEHTSTLLLLPYSERTVAWSICAAGILLVVLGNVFPLALLLGVAGAMTPLEALAGAALGVIITTISFVAETVSRRHAGLVACLLTAVACLCALIFSSDSLRFCALLILLIIAVGVGGKIPHARRRHTRHPLAFPKRLPSNYFAIAALSERHVYLSALGLLCLGTILTATLASRGFPYPLNAVCAVSIPPLSTMLSRDRDTYRQMELLGNRYLTFVQYFVVLFVASLILTSISTIVLVAIGAAGAGFFAIGILICIIGSMVSVLLEMRFPLLVWKTEQEVYTHPRKYLVTLVAALLAGLYLVIA